MRDLRNASIASMLAVALGLAAVPAVAQSSTSGSTGTQGSGATTGTLPDNSLAGQRQGAIDGGKVQQGEQGATAGQSGSTASPTGTLPDNSLAGQRQGAIGGGSVSQGGSGSTETPQQPRQGTGQ